MSAPESAHAAGEAFTSAYPVAHTVEQHQYAFALHQPVLDRRIAAWDQANVRWFDVTRCGAGRARVAMKPSLVWRG